MQNYKYVIPPLILTCLTSVSLFSTPLTNEQDINPTQKYDIPSINLNIDHNTNYDLSFFKSFEKNSLNAYSNFVNNIIEKSIDLDPKISKLVDDNFWDLLL